MGRRWAIRALNFKEVSYENGNFRYHCSDNLEPNSKGNSEYAVLCSLLRGSQFFFFCLSMVMRSAITTLKLKEVSTVNGMLPELQTAFYFSKASCNCWKRFSACCGDSERLHFRSSNGYVIRMQALNVARLHLAVLGGRVLCVNVNNCCCYSASCHGRRPAS